jgi:V/A-type H+/Na+-transporting ATPase subunit E
MSALNTFEEEIQDRKKKELAILNSLLDEKKNRVAQIKNERLTEIKEKYDSEAENKAKREFARITESARLEAKKILFDAINVTMDTAMDSIKQELEYNANKANYKKTLEDMVLYAKRYLGADVIVRCKESDVNYLKDKKVTIGPNISTMGGIIAVDKSNSREIDLTFEELLENHEDEIKNFLYEKMI